MAEFLLYCPVGHTKVYGYGVLMPLSTIFQLYHNCVWLVEKTTDLLQVRQTLSHNVLSTPRLRGIRTCNIIGDSHWLHRYLLIQLPYDHDHNSPLHTGKWWQIDCIIYCFSEVIRDDNKYTGRDEGHGRTYKKFTTSYY